MESSIIFKRYLHQIGFVLVIEGQFVIRKAINVTDHINSFKKKSEQKLLSSLKLLSKIKIVRNSHRHKSYLEDRAQETLQIMAKSNIIPFKTVLEQDK